MKKILVLLFLLFFLFKPANVFAEVIHSFEVDILTHKNGIMDIVETINYDFENEYKHGIYRYIPLYSRVGDLYRIIKIKNAKVLRDGQNENFTITQTNEQIYFKIGDADKTINGPHIYKIFYTVENGIGSNYADHDEIYWNATGNDWDVVIEKASIRFDNDFNTEQNDLICFSGQTGSTERNCNVFVGTIVSSQILNIGEGLSAVAKYPKGTFPPSQLVKELPKSFGEKIAGAFLSNIYLIYILLNIILPLVLIYWYQKNKNKKRFGPPVVNFDTPEDEKGQRLAPALAGTIDTAKLERDDIVATIFDLAIRKYIRLEETKTTRNLLPDSKEQKVIKLKEDDGKLKNFEKSLFNRLFESGDSIKVSDLKLDFYKTFQQMEKDVFSELVSKKYYTKNPAAQKALLLICSLISFFTFNLILAAVLFWLSRKLNGRTSLGDEIDFKIDGLKLFLKSMDRNYKWQAKNLYTVEAMIPYAMALGYIDKFMEALKILKPDYNPSWYSGSGNFYASYAVFSAAATSNITTSAPSSSSGFSGGSSGGGGGGGGGGSW